MDIEVTEKHDNLLLERTEVRLIAKHPKEATPKRKELKDAIMETLDVKKGVLVIDTMDSEFGKNETKVFLKVYANVEKARAIENDHILKRNGLFEEKKKQEAS
jgi:small subunit ribosomal protein S24e